MFRLCLLASESVGEYYQFARVQAMSEWWHWLMLLAVCIIVVGYVIWLYRRDGVEHSRWLRFLLVILRFTAFAGILFYFMNLEKRTERKITKNSRALLLVDTSQSMGLQDAERGESSITTRIQRIVQELSGGTLLHDLREKHDVVVYRFDQAQKPVEVAVLPRTFDASDGSESDPTERPEQDPTQSLDWASELAARGMETRLGEAMRYLINKERGGPVAGIVVFSDGQLNAGTEQATANAMARMAEIPIYTVGMGSDRRPMNVRVVDLEAPERVYPGDRFTLTGYIQATGLASRSVSVKLTSAPTGVPDRQKVEVIEAEDRISLGKDGEIVAVKFDVTPKDSGRQTYQLAVRAPPRDHNDRDNSKNANVEVVERRNRVLLIAGGPSREYRFLRNQLYRDQETILDIWLQSGQVGMSQEADNLLDGFPETSDDLFEYDCIIAFDPDWMALDLLQIENLEQWVAEKAGGLIVVAGPVHTPQWADARRNDSRLNTIRSLYPVVLYSSGSATLGLGRFGGKDAWPLQFTRDGLEAEFLWLEDDALQSEAAWASFDGVFGYYAVKDPKPGARVYARFSDPNTAIDRELPIYLAGHFYGAGRVFFQASGEMWRIRAVDETYFEQYYTKLIRWVSQGRLLQDSSHGVLLVDKDRCLLGDTIGVQAMLTDAQNRPLNAPEATASLIDPSGIRSPLKLQAVQGAVRMGTFAGQFTALAEGDYRIELRPPHGELDELLVREVRVRIPALEIEKPQRNDPLLLDIANSTGGKYYVGLDAAMGRAGGQTPLAQIIEPQDYVTYLPGTPDRDFDRWLMTLLMAIIAGSLCCEWLIRRLSRLA